MTPEKIILHHSATKDSGTVSWRAIRRYHMQVQGWLDIGYHFGIERIDDWYEILCGRLMTEMGAHCRQQAMNHKSLGVCFVGNFDEQAPSPAQWLLGVRLVRSLLQVFRLNPDDVLGHREADGDDRTCPGRKFDMARFREAIIGLR